MKYEPMVGDVCQFTGNRYDDWSALDDDELVVVGRVDSDGIPEVCRLTLRGKVWDTTFYLTFPEELRRVPCPRLPLKRLPRPVGNLDIDDEETDRIWTGAQFGHA